MLGQTFDTVTDNLETGGPSKVDVWQPQLSYYGLPYRHCKDKPNFKGQPAVHYTFDLFKTPGQPIKHDEVFVVYDGKCVECDIKTKKCNLKVSGKDDNHVHWYTITKM